MRFVWVSLLLACGLAKAQMPAATVDEALTGMARRAGVIFAGEVISVNRRSAEPVEVRFAVREAVLGCAAGSVYTMREWSGRAGGGTARYPVGQSYLMLLYAPGPGGMSSPVDGQSGVVPISGKAVDLRWVAANGVKVREGSPVHSGPGSISTRQSGPTLLLEGNYVAVMRMLRTAVGSLVVHPIFRPRPVTGLLHVER